MNSMEKQAKNIARKSMTKKAWKRAMSNDRREMMPRPAVFADKRFVEKYKRVDEFV